MRKKAELVIVAVLIAAAIMAGPQTARYVMNMKAETEPARIVLDPGQGAYRQRRWDRRSEMSVCFSLPEGILSRLSRVCLKRDKEGREKR